MRPTTDDGPAGRTARGSARAPCPHVRAPTAAPAAAQDGQFDLDLTYLTDEIIAMVRRARTTHRCEPPSRS